LGLLIIYRDTLQLLVRLSAFLSVLSILLLQGCATSAQKTAYMRNLVSTSHYDLALVEAEKALSKDPSGVMENMNVGLLRRLENDFAGSNRAFETAKQKIDVLYTSSITEYAGASLTNDENISFQGDRFEQILLHLYMASNYLQLGELDSARVELLQSQTKMSEWGEAKDEIPFMRYFSGILFEMMGEEDSAAVAYRKAVDAYKNTYAKHGLNVPAQLKYDLLRVLANMRLWDELERYKKQLGLSNYKVKRQTNQSALVVVLGNGMVAQRQQRLFHTWSPELKYNIRIAVPDYIFPPAYVNKARVRIADQSYMMQTVSNVDGLARAALSENMHIITARAIARAVVKKKTELKLGEKSGSLGQMAAMVANFGSEIADTRGWNTLPQQFELARIALPAGEYNVAIELLNSAGYIVDVIYEDVTVEPGAVTVINKRWTSPVVRSDPVVKKMDR
jgi:uncharacterized protein